MMKRLAADERFDLLDKVEAAQVEYMAKSRGLQEGEMRRLIFSDANVRASYERKCKRFLDVVRHHGIKL